MENRNHIFVGGVVTEVFLAAMPAYTFANGWIPNTIIRDIEKLFTDFLWGKGEDMHAFISCVG